MNPETMTIALFGALLVGLAMGIPLAFVLGGISVIFAYFLWGSQTLYVVGMRVSSVQMSLVLVTAPLFYLMANMLEKSGIADDLYNMMYHWIGPVKGGLAIGTVWICTLFAAMSGISGVAAITMGVIALPSMFKRHYDKSIALGCISAGAALGILIPPSIIMIFYGYMAQQSVGQLFMGGVFPGLLLSALFSLYIGIRSYIQPNLCPPLPAEERVDWRLKIASLRAVVLPALLVVGVLGSIFMGVASPTEAAAVGAFGSVICAAIYRKLNWKMMMDASRETLKLTAMGMWIVIGASSFTAVYTALGGQELVTSFIAGLGVNRWLILIGMQLSFFIMGCLLDPIGIIMLTSPIYVPIITHLGFNPLWFGILYTINMEMAYITPPFGWNLFYLKAIVPPGITMVDIYRSIIPFVVLQAIGLIIVMIFPELALWLPRQMIRTS